MFEASAQTPSLPKIWKGETVEADQGLVSLYSVMIDTKTRLQNRDFSFVLKGRKHPFVYHFAAHTLDPKEIPHQFWKIRADIYELWEVRFVDEGGRTRKWQGPYPKPLIVSPQSLSSLGIWYLFALKDDSIKVLLKPHPITLPPQKWKGDLQTTSDGFTGSILSRFKTEVGEKQLGLRRVLRGSRAIQMSYKLDLFQNNSVASEMARVFQANDADIRSCYTDLLEKQGDAKGDLIYSFVYSGIAQGIKSLKVKRSALKDSEFQECLYFKLRALTFPQRQSLAGELSFHFKVVEAE